MKKQLLILVTHNEDDFDIEDYFEIPPGVDRATEAKRILVAAENKIREAFSESCPDEEPVEPLLVDEVELYAFDGSVYSLNESDGFYLYVVPPDEELP